MYVVDKHRGETPLQALRRLRAEAHIAPDIPLTYAGRLDPLATGKLLILVGDECRDRARYLGLDKAYELDILFGAHSDSGDILGIVTAVPAEKISPDALVEAASHFVGPYCAPYPAYASKTVHGKPLFAWAQEGRLKEIDIPHQNGTIHALRVVSLEERDATSLAHHVMEGLHTLDPNTARGFRVSEARASWKQLFKEAPVTLSVARLAVRTSSGVYMRTLADDIARALGTRGLALRIHRTDIFVD